VVERETFLMRDSKSAFSSSAVSWPSLSESIREKKSAAEGCEWCEIEEIMFWVYRRDGLREHRGLCRRYPVNRLCGGGA